MSSKTAAPAADGAPAPPKKKGMMIIVLAVVAVLLAALAGLWFTGILPKMLGMAPKQAAKAGGAHMEAGSTAPPVYLDVPEILTNLNVPGRRQSYLKLHAKLELGSAGDTAAVTTAMPRIVDLFQTYLRDMRPEELRGSEGSYRLREELVERAGVAAAPAQIRAVLFEEFIIQ